jgi:predicted RNA-binding protein
MVNAMGFNLKVENKPKYWIVVASWDHVQRGITAGCAQACHGKASPLRRMHKGDWLVYYSSKIKLGEAERCQKFTAIGQLKDDQIYQFDMGNGFVPFRRNVDYRGCREVSIIPLIGELSFIRDKKHWGVPFRFGLLEIPEQDFRLIAEHMLSIDN